MNRLAKSLALGLTIACSCISVYAANSALNTGSSSDTMSSVSVEAIVEPDSVEETSFVDNLAQNNDIWKYKRKFMLGFTTGTLDQKKRFGGEISSRWGVSIVFGRNIYLHSKPIGGFLKFGLNIDAAINYMNFAKGSGKISDIMHPGDDDYEMGAVSLGRHYLTSGLAVGPTASFAPFYASNNRKLASLIFRPYFHVVPSFATYIISDDDDTELHNAFAFWCAAGLEIQWKRLIIGFEWKGCTAKYKGMMEDIMSAVDDGYEAEGSHKFDMNMLNFSIGLAF